MLKSKFLAGLVATLICFVLVVGAAIVMVVVFNMDESGNMPKIIAFAAIAVWLGIYGWLKPKPVVNGNDDSTSKLENKTDRNSYK